MRYILIFFYPLLLFAVTGASSDLKKTAGAPIGPWLTGPLLTTSAYTMPPGHTDLEPYVLWTHTEGSFDPRGHVHKTNASTDSLSMLFLAYIGLTENIDISLYPLVSYKEGAGRDKLGMGDIGIETSYQLIREDPRFHGVTCRVGLSQVFPCGKFENLYPVLFGGDAFGLGGWSTRLYIAATKIFHLRKENFLAPIVSVATIFYSPIDVTGCNAFGGDATTKGVVNRGMSVIVDVAFELTLSLHWALALDIENTYITGSTFSGETIEPVGNPKSSYLVSLAPAIEYNFSKNYGLIGGVWFTPYGSNADDFISFVLAFNMYL
jgi:hypothetical protein